jgi:hypothetical protein
MENQDLIPFVENANPDDIHCPLPWGHDDLGDDDLGWFKYRALPTPVFTFEPKDIFRRFGGGVMLNTWLKDGTLVIPEIFSYLREGGIPEMIDTEFQVYRHHQRTDEDRNGWLYMFYSLIQQLVRVDPVLYAITVAIREDRQWRLVNYPCITRDTDLGESTEDLDLDKDIGRYMEDVQGQGMITGRIALEDEQGDGCTLFGLKLSRGEINHGSGRSLFTCYTGVKENHEELDIKGLSWNELWECHSDLKTPKKGPDGKSFRLLPFRFPAAVRLDSCSILGEALLARRGWMDPQVLEERDILLGTDDIKAQKYVEEVRKSMVDAYISGFRKMEKRERAAYGKNSYFFMRDEMEEDKVII